MAPSKARESWDEDDSDSTPPSSPPLIARRGKFDDEEEDDVLDSWDAAEDSEVEREKAKKAAEAKAKAEAAAKASHKSKSERIEERRQANLRRRQEEDGESSGEEETEAERRARMREQEKQADLANAEDLFGGVGGVPASRGAVRPVTVQEGEDPASAIELSSLKIFNPNTTAQFGKLRETLVPLLTANAKKALYSAFLPEFVKQISKDLTSEQIKKIASSLTAMSNEKMREEKAAEKGGKKTKAAKTKTSLSAGRDITSRADLTAYDDDGLDDGDFM